MPKTAVWPLPVRTEDLATLRPPLASVYASVPRATGAISARVVTVAGIDRARTAVRVSITMAFAAALVRLVFCHRLAIPTIALGSLHRHVRRSRRQQYNPSVTGLDAVTGSDK